MKNQRNYDKEFKINAVKLYKEGNKSLNELANNLGIPMTTLAGWVKKYQESGENSFVGSGNLLPCNEEIVKLRRELADIKEERDILKKAVAIFSKVKK
jgi:transposase